MTPERIRGWGAIFAWPVDHPWPGFLVISALVVFSAVWLPEARVDFSLEELYPHDNEEARFAAAHRDRFGRDDNAILAVREGDPFDPALARAEAAIAAVPGVSQALSPHTFETVFAERSGPDDPGLLTTRPLRPGEHHPFATGLLVAEHGDAGAVMARVSDAANHHAGRQEIVAAIEEIVAREGGTWHLAGIPVIRTWFVRLMLMDMGWLIPLALAVSTAFYVASFRDLRHVALGISAVGLGAAAAGAAYAATGTAFNIFAPAFVAVIVIVGTSDIVHLVHRFAEKATRLPPREAARTAAAEVGLACLLTSATSAIGFLSLRITAIPPIRTFGLATGLGVLLTFVVAFLLVPPVLGRMGPPRGRAVAHAQRGAGRMTWLGEWVLLHRRGVLAAAALFTAGTVALAAQARVEHKVLEDVRPSETVAVSQRYVEDHLGAVLPLQVEVRFDARDPRDPEAFAAVDELAAWMRRQPQLGQVVGLGDLARLAWSELAGPHGELGPRGLPPTRDAVGQALLVLGLGSEDPVPTMLWEGDPPRIRIVARARDLGYEATRALVEATRAQAAALLDPLGGHAEITGVARLAQEVISTLTTQFAGSFGVALLLIGLVWLAVTRSPRHTLVALVPNLIPLLALLGLLGATGLTLKPATAMVLSVALGIAVDDAIHFLAVYERGRLDGRDPQDAALNAYRTAGRSLVDTTVLLVLGFVVLARSRFTATYYFGLLTAWTLVVALGTNLFVLGPLLVTADRRAPGKR